MERHIDMNEISDGKRYHRNDMVKLDCQEGEGCSECCHKVGDSIILDPWDIYMLTTNLKMNFSTLLEKYIGLNVVDGLILPHIRLDSEEEGCHFLDKQGRCSIHKFRPGICRLFPLGRIYENDSFSYFLQTKECHIERRGKVKISKWLSIPNLERYESYIISWHFFCKKLQNHFKEMDEEAVKNCCMYLLQNFFVNAYEETEFYPQFETRLQNAKAILGIA